jgi:glycosyltransferase involved in cell wall biosynthesis
VRGALGVTLRVLGAEGAAAVRDRFLDRVDEWRRRRTFRPPRGGRGITAGVLNVLPTPPARRLGGIQIQFLRRLMVEAEKRAFALLYPDGRTYRLERQQASRRDALALPRPVVGSAISLEDAAFETAVLRAAELSNATAVHIEGLAGIPPASVLRLGGRGLRIILSLHDFALFCPRPDLLEQPSAQFCDYCEELPRCRACLSQHWNLPADFQARYREVGAELLRSAQAVVYPSTFLRSKFFDLVPGLDREVHHVIALGSPAPAAGSLRVRVPGPVRHVAFVGAVHVRKGALVFEEVVRRMAPERLGIHWSVFGGGDADLLQRLSRLPGVSTHGYYRAGTLPRLLQRRRVDLALLLSIIPESYGLTLDECQEAGVPVIAFDHGAVAERVRARGGGILVSLEEQWRGVARTVRAAVADGQLPRPSTITPSRVHEAAHAYLRLYRALGVS